MRPAPYTLPPALLAKAITLTRLRTILAFGGTAWTILVLLSSSPGAGPPPCATGPSASRPTAGSRDSSFSPIAILFLTLVSLPLDIYSHHIGRAYGLSVQSWPSWSLDQLKGLGLSLVVMTPLLLLLFWVIRVAPTSPASETAFRACDYRRLVYPVSKRRFRMPIGNRIEGSL